MRATRLGRITVKVAITVLGAVFVGVGIVLLPLPGPGWLIIFAGLAIWAIEFHWARVLLGFVRRGFLWWTHLMRTGHWLLRTVMWAFMIAVVAGAASLSLWYAFGVDVRDLLAIGE